MKVATVTLVTLGALACLPATSTQAAEQALDVPPLPAFTAIEFHGAGTLDVAVGAAQSVVAQGEADKRDRVHFAVVKDTLVIDQQGYLWRGGDATLKVQVSLPALTELTARGRSVIQVHGLNGGSTRVLLARSAALTASGTLATLSAEVDGDSSADLRQLSVPTAKLVVPEWGRVRLNPNTLLSAASVGVGSLSATGTRLPQKAAAGEQARQR